MSEKSVKKDHKLKLMTEEADFNESAKEQAKAIGKMYEDRDKKAMDAKEHLVAQLEITVDKYRTANGVMSALDTLRTVMGEGGENKYAEIQAAQRLAKRLSVVTTNMAATAKRLDPEEMDKLCDGFYDMDLVNKNVGPEDLAEQLMILQLCQNVGPSTEDIADFCRTADDEIEKARGNLKDFCAGHGIDFNELCGPHDNCPECLCNICTNDCKEGKMIVEGQSAREICDDFIVEGKE